jgi:hypothetical protein
VPRRVDDDCLQELRWLYDRRDCQRRREDASAGRSKIASGWDAEGPHGRAFCWATDRMRSRIAS